TCADPRSCNNPLSSVSSVFSVVALSEPRMSLQEVKDQWIYLDRNTGIWRGHIEAAQGVFQPIHWVAMHRMQCMLRLMPHEGLIADIGCSYGILTLNMAAKKPRAQLLG